MTSIAIVGGSLSGNRGAASMVHGVIDGLAAAGWPTDAVVLTPIPADDATVGSTLPLIAFGPAQIVRTVVEAAMVQFAGRGPQGPATRAIAQADVVVDVSGISFVDSRAGATLAYNILLMLPAVLLGRPVVKVAQAMGPFERPVNRKAAIWVLSRMAAVHTRGTRTHALVAELGVPVTRADDVAFLMEVTAEDHAWAHEVTAGQACAVVSPSSVVVAQDDGTYVDAMGALVRHLAASRSVLLLPHSSRPGTPASKLNDLPLCEELAAAAGHTAHPVRVVGADASPQQMRALIAAATVCVTSRFHAMISSLAVATPVVVVSWSHKYREVLDEFGLAHTAIDFRAVTAKELAARTDETIVGATVVRDQIRTALPEVLTRARANIISIRTQLESAR